MGLPMKNTRAASLFLEKLVLVPQSAGGRGVWESVHAGLITEVEGRNLFLSHVATWLSHEASAAEPCHEQWGSRALDETVERALYGRLADINPKIDLAFSRRRLAQAWGKLPDEIRSTPALEADLEAFEREFGEIPEEFRWFLLDCGGGVVGSEWVDDVHTLPDSHRKFAAESAQDAGWTMRGVFVIGWDGAGNPMAIERASQRVLVEDHQYGGVHELAPSFLAMLAAALGVRP